MATDLTDPGTSDFGPKASAKHKAGMSVLDFFDVATNRMDNWNDVNNAAVRLSHAKASGHDVKDLEDRVKSLLAYGDVFESSWA